MACLLREAGIYTGGVHTLRPGNISKIVLMVADLLQLYGKIYLGGGYY